MKRGGFLLLALVVFSLYSDIAANVLDLDVYCRGHPKPACTKDYALHCGSDGVTYVNKCYFCNAYVYSGRKLQLKPLRSC